MNTIVFTRRADVADAAAPGKHKHCIILKEQCRDGGRGSGEGVFLCLGCNLNLGAHKASRVHTFLPVSARRPACLSTGMLRCVSRLGLRNQLRALLWLDVSLSFVPRWDTHNKLSMNSHNTVIVLSTAPPASQGLRRGQEKLWVHPGRETPPPHRHPKSILETEAEGDVTHQYVHRPLCLDHGPSVRSAPLASTHKSKKCRATY